MSLKVFIVGKKTTFGTRFKKFADIYEIETVFVEKTQEVTTTALSQTDALVFLETIQAQEWMNLACRFPPSLLLPELFPPPIPFKKLADANMRLMPKETEGHVLAQLLLLDMELHRFQKSIADLSEEDRQSMFSIFEEFRHSLSAVCLQIQGLLSKLFEHPDSKEICSELRLVIHRLAGSSGSYGFMALSKAAKTIEQAIDKQEQLQIQNLTHQFIDMLSPLLLPPTQPSPLSKTFLIYEPRQQARNPYVHGFRNLALNAAWGMDWVECWKLAQNCPLDGAILNVDNLPVECWPPLFEALASAPAFAALPKHLLKQNANDAEKTCAARLHCLGPDNPPATFEEMAAMLRKL